MSQKIVDAVLFDNYTLIEDKAAIHEAFKDEVNKSRGAILAIVKGKHFCPDGTSRNHRYYPKALWLGVKNDENFMARLKRNGVIGRVGHEPEITDEDIGEGNYSHFTRNINWETGEAESVIVDTPMGRNLLTALRAGIQLFVSSRATGDYCGKNDEGNDIMDPATYALERFDFVQDPGFLEAHPTLVSESLEKGKVRAKIAEALLGIAQKIGASILLDGRRYLVESLDSKGIHLETEDTHLRDVYESSAFEDVVPEIEKAIVSAATVNEALAKDLKAANEDLKIVRFANEQGLDEEYVRNRMASGASLEAIAKEHVPPTATYHIAEGVSPSGEHVRRAPKRESVLDRIFCG